MINHFVGDYATTLWGTSKHIVREYTLVKEMELFLRSHTNSSNLEVSSTIFTRSVLLAVVCTLCSGLMSMYGLCYRTSFFIHFKKSAYNLPQWLVTKILFSESKRTVYQYETKSISVIKSSFRKNDFWSVKHYTFSLIGLLLLSPIFVIM